MESSSKIAPPPRDGPALRAWAKAHGVAPFLDMVATGAPTAPLFDRAWDREGASQTFDELLSLVPEPWNHSARSTQDDALKLLAAFAQARVRHDIDRERFRNAEAQSEPLAAFVTWLRAAHAKLDDVVRMPGRTLPGAVHLGDAPAPYLQYVEQDLALPPHLATRICRMSLMGWEASFPHLVLWRERGASAEPASPELQRGALEAFVRFACGDASPKQLEQLRHALVTPGWSYLLKELDGELDALNLSPPQPNDTRVAFRVHGVAPDLQIEPVLQKRRKGSKEFSSGAKLQWWELRERVSQLEPEDLQVLRAYHDPRNRSHNALTSDLVEETFACLMALRNHPRVFAARGGEALQLEAVSVSLRFVEAEHAHLIPTFELGPLTLSPREFKALCRDGKHVIAHAQEQPATIFLATLNPATAALMRAFATAPVKIAVEAKEELLARLAPVQPFVDMELPPSWVGELRTATAQVVVRLTPQQNGSLHVAMFVRPLKGGPVWPAGQGPQVVLGGIYQQRHSVRRDFASEETAVADLVVKLGLHEVQSPQAHHFDLPAGDPVFAWLERLAPLEQQGLLQVEWPRQGILAPGPALARADLRLRVNTHQDWFSLEGAAQSADGSQIPLAALLTAAREGRQYVVVGGGRFYKLRDDLRALLEQAGGDLLATADESIRLGKAQAANFLGLLDDPEQVQADAAFLSFRKRLQQSAEISVCMGPVLRKVLRPYQHQGVQFLVRLAHWGAGAVLADEMGLGKTLQALAVLEHRAAQGPALVVAPTSVGTNWLQEAHRFAPDLRVRPYRDGARADMLLGLGPKDVLVTSYAIVVRDAEALSQVPFATVVLDEAQAIKNAGTERARAVRGLKAEWKLALTGTPVENHLSELWSLFHTITPGLLGSWQRFRAVFSVPIERYQDLNRRRRLAAIIRPYVLRRRKDQVAQELPPRTEIVRRVVLGPAEQKHYETLRQATLAALEKKKDEKNQPDAPDVRMMLLAALTRLRQLACHPRLVHPDAGPSSSKLELLLRLALELRDNGSRALVFSQFRTFLDLVQPHLEAAGLATLRLDGTTPAGARGPLVEKFQAGHADLFLISLKAGGVGLNLTAADVVIHLDPWWNPAVEDQASDRAHRIGQQKPVTVVRLVAEGTVEEAVLALHEQKRNLVAGVLEGSDVAGALSVNELVSLIKC